MLYFEEKMKEDARKYNYLLFLYNATHPKPFCSSPPHQVYIEATNSCNLKCAHCPQHTMRRERTQLMSLKLFKKIVEELAPYQPFVDLYLQGESLIHPEIVTMVSIARQHGLLPRITTNTTILSKKKSQALIDVGLDKVEFSMSGASKKTYDSIYHGAAFEKTLQNMLDFLEANGARGFPVHTRSVFVEEEKTIHEKDKYLKYFALLPLDDVYVSPLINMFGWNKEMDLNPFKKLPREQWPVCKTPWRQFGINADGTVRSCIFDYDSRYLIGDANNVNVMELWNGPQMQNFRKTIIEKRYEDFDKPGLPLCTECSQIWPTSPLSDTTQLPKDFLGESETFLKNESGAFKAKYADKHEKEKKLEYLKNNRKKWMDEVLADVN